MDRVRKGSKGLSEGGSQKEGEHRGSGLVMKLRSHKTYNSPKKKIKTENRMNRFTQMLDTLNGNDLTLKLLTLQDLSEFTSMATGICC